MAFRDQDPNGNGEADEIPLGISAANDSSHFDSLFGSFGTLDNSRHIRVDGDKVVFTPAEDGYYEGLKWFHRLYEEGLMNRDYFIVKETPEDIIKKIQDYNAKVQDIHRIVTVTDKR